MKKHGMEDRMDLAWAKIGNLSSDNIFRYKELSLVMRGIVTIPHGSAHCERIFSCVRGECRDMEGR